MSDESFSGSFVSSSSSSFKAAELTPPADSVPATKVDAASVQHAVVPEAKQTEASLHAAITRALLSGRLSPGTPLRERYLAQEFEVTRGLVRKVLLRLGQEGKLEIHENRGAFVPRPSSEQIRHTYQARKAVEAGVLSLLAGTMVAGQRSQLKAHLCAEYEAQREGRRDESVRLAGDFHLLLADLLGNAELREIVQRLIVRTQMFVALFEPSQASGCSQNEHEAVVEALEKGDTAAAIHAMHEHLSLVEQRVLARVNNAEMLPVAEILRAVLRS